MHLYIPSTLGNLCLFQKFNQYSLPHFFLRLHETNFTITNKLEFDALLMLLNPINSILYKFDKWFTGQILGSVCRNDTADFSLAIGVNPYSRLNAVL